MSKKMFGKVAWDAYRKATTKPEDLPDWHYLASDTQRMWDVFGANCATSTLASAVAATAEAHKVLEHDDSTLWEDVTEEHRSACIKAFEAVREDLRAIASNDAKRSQDKRMYSVIREHINSYGTNYRLMADTLASQQGKPQATPKDVFAKHVIGQRKYAAHNIYRFTYYTREGLLLSCDVLCDALKKALLSCDTVHPQNFDYIPQVVTFGEAFRALTEYRCRIYRPDWLIPYPVGLAEDGTVVHKYKLLAWLSYSTTDSIPRIYKKGIVDDTATVMTTLWEPGQNDLFSVWVSKRKGK